MQQVDDAAFDQLRFWQWRGHTQDGLIRKEGSALLHGVHVTGEPQFRQSVNEIVGKESAVLYPCQFTGREAQILQVLQYLLQADRLRTEAPHLRFRLLPVIGLHIDRANSIAQNADDKIQPERVPERVQHTVIRRQSADENRAYASLA